MGPENPRATAPGERTGPEPSGTPCGDPVLGARMDPPPTAPGNQRSPRVQAAEPNLTEHGSRARNLHKRR
jgi:hypothetical protein